MNHVILNNTEYLFSIALKKTGNLTDAEDLTKAEIMAREQAFEMFEFLKNNLSVLRTAIC